MQINTSKVMRGVVERVDSESYITVLTSGHQWLTLRQDYGMYPTSTSEWVFEGCTPAQEGEAIILFEQGTGAVWVHSEDYYEKQMNPGN